MIPNKAFDLAQEGGYPRVPKGARKNWERYALDPAFFQALGKALGTDKKHLYLYNSFIDGKEVEGWPQWAMHRFLDYLILTGQDTAAFWQKLLQ